ncbi:MAG: GTP-binding protein TrmE N-terminus, partial [Planctomycetota bacterium]
MLRLRLATARAPGAVAVVELDGGSATEAHWQRALAGLGLAAPRPGAVSLRRLDCGAGLVDEVLVVGLEPRLLELHPAGAPPLVEALLARLESLGVRAWLPRSCAERADAALAAAEG